MSYPRSILLALAGLLSLGIIGRAQTINWTGNSSTDWNTATNWDVGVVPSSGNDVILDTNSGNQAVLSSENATIGNLTVGNINGGADTSLAITNGANLTATSLTIGAQAGSNGTVTISGVNSTLVVSNLTVGTGLPASSGGRSGIPTPSTLSNGSLQISSGTSLIDSGSFSLSTNGTFIQSGGLVEFTSPFSRRTIVSPPGTTPPLITLNFVGVYNLFGGILQSTSGLYGSGTLILGGGTVQISTSADYAISTTLLDGTTSTVNLNLPISPIFGPAGCLWAGNINGNGNLEVTGTGQLVIDGYNTYTGTTTISGCTLLVDGNLSASNVTVNSGGTLTGQGNIAGSVTVNSGGSISPSAEGGGPGASSAGGGGGGGFGTGNGFGGGTTSGGGGGGTRRIIVAPAGAITVDAAGAGTTGGGSGSAGASGGTGSTTGNSTSGGGTGVGGTNQISPLTIGSLTLASGAMTGFGLNAPNFYSDLLVTGPLVISGNLVLNLSNPVYAGTYQLITAGSQSGDFDNVSVSGFYSGALTENNGVWSGNFSGVNVTFTTATGVATVSVNLPTGTSTGLTTWLEDYFTTTQLLAPTVSGDAATPAGDGVPNLTKYAFGLNPFSNAYLVNNSSPVLPQSTTDGTNLILTFTESQSDIVYTPEVSTDLVNWSTAGVTVTMNGNVATATYPLPVNGSAFMRVVVAPAGP